MAGTKPATLERHSSASNTLHPSFVRASQCYSSGLEDWDFKELFSDDLGFVLYSLALSSTLILFHEGNTNILYRLTIDQCSDWYLLPESLIPFPVSSLLLGKTKNNKKYNKIVHKEAIAGRLLDELLLPFEGSARLGLGRFEAISGRETSR